MMAKANARLVYPKPRQRKVQIQGFFASLRMTRFDGGYSNPEFALSLLLEAAFMVEDRNDTSPGHLAGNTNPRLRGLNAQGQ
jgi:hypothetical protein